MRKISKRKYWFKPARFWKCFACYYPVSMAGWVVTLILVETGIAIFVAIDQTSHSASDTLLRFAPWAIGILAVFDLISFRSGEYPTWWRRK